MMVILGIIYTFLAHHWAKKFTTQAMDSGVSDYKTLRKKVSNRVMLRVFIHFFIITLLFAMGAQSERQRQDALVGYSLRFSLVLAPVVFAIYLGTRRIFRARSKNV